MQSYPYLEIVVVDDGSTDHTRDVVLSLCRELNTEYKHIRYIRQENRGACFARNTGMLASCGEFIQFLDSDDEIARDKFEIQIADLKQSGAPVSLCDFEYVNETGSTIKQVRNDGNIFEYLSNFRSVFISTPLMTRASIIHGLSWNTSLAQRQDMDFIFRYFLTIESWVYSPGFYSKYYMHSGEQIRDSYGEGIPVELLVKSFRDFQSREAKNISQKNMRYFKKYIRTLRVKKVYQTIRKIQKLLLRV